MANTKHEDAILKMGFDYFRDTILKILGIHHDFVESGITELVELTIHSLYMDFTFLTKDDFYIHIEFQTTDSGKKDLRRFHAYESVLSHKTGKNVITYVIYSGGIEHAVTEMKCGTYTYRVIPIFLTAKDADSVLKRLREKKQRGEIFTEEDFAQLAITPLMSSEIKRKDVILESIKLSKTEKSITAEKTMAMLYTLADKFLTGNDLEEVKEAVAMTRIGQMIFDDGVVRGREEERRLMYVAITRAMKKLWITSAKKRMIYGQESPSVLSRFVREIDPDLIEKINKEEKEQVKKEKRVYKEDRVFSYGDKVNHEIYGDGVVIEVTNTILTVAFNKDVGIKKILKNHKSIRRV